MSITSWFLRQFRLNSFDIDSGKGLVATEKFKKLQVSGFSMEIQKVSGKKKKKRSASYCTWRLYPATPTIPITSKLQRGAYLGRAAVNLNSDTAALSQSLRPAKMLADLLSWELMLSGDCDHKNATKSKALGASFLFPVQRDKVPQRQQAEISSLHPSRITY